MHMCIYIPFYILKINARLGTKLKATHTHTRSMDM